MKKSILTVIAAGYFLLIFTAISNAAVIAVNAGHQRFADLEKEPVAPNSAVLKYKVSAGTCGIISKMPEYELNLQNALLLKQELVLRGHKVVMIRETNEVSISNKERVAFALENGAELIINLHANAPGKNQSKYIHGIMTLCRSANNTNSPSVYISERKLAELVQSSLCSETGAQNLGVRETDSMTGINWSSVPSIIVEVGYMTNIFEDIKLQEESYKRKIVCAIAEGIEKFLAEK